MPTTVEEQEVKLETMRAGSFAGGMNTSLPATKIRDDELVLALNFEYDDNDELVCRNGVVGTQGIIGVWDQTLWDQSLWDQLGVTYPSKITSELDFEGASAFVGFLYTTGTKLISRTVDGSVITDLTGALVLPDGVRWYWKIFNGVAIGVNGLTSGDNPIKVVAPAPGIASKLTQAPPGNFVEVWGNRVWISRSDQPNQLQASDIGAHDSWNTDAGANPAHGSLWDLDKDDGDRITGLYATKERLFVFKKKSILVGEAKDPAKPITDLRNIAFNKYASNIGCIAATTIRPVFDDVLFLADGGIGSLSAAQIVANFESAIISLKVADLQDIRRDLTDEDVFSFVVSDRNQYWIGVSANVSSIGRNIVYVFDYRRIKSGQGRWHLFDGLAFPTAMEVVDHDVEDLTYLIGCHDTVNNVFFLGKYIPKAANKIFIDSTLSIDKILITKAYDFEFDDLRKFLHSWFLKLLLLTNNVSISISYLLDESTEITGTYTFNLVAELGGVLFDDPLIKFDDGELFDAGVQSVVERIRKSFLYGTPENPKPRKAVTVQFKIVSSQINQGFGITGFNIKYQLLSEFKAATV